MGAGVMPSPSSPEVARRTDSGVIRTGELALLLADIMNGERVYPLLTYLLFNLGKRYCYPYIK